jgi:hypothetical protein
MAVNDNNRIIYDMRITILVLDGVFISFLKACNLFFAMSRHRKGFEFHRRDLKRRHPNFALSLISTLVAAI